MASPWQWIAITRVAESQSVRALKDLQEVLVVEHILVGIMSGWNSTHFRNAGENMKLNHVNLM